MHLSLLEDPTLVSRNHYLLKFEYNNDNIQPGQFLNIKVSQNSDPLIRRPFSIYNYDNNILEIIIQVVGKGTKAICKYVKNDKLDILVPLGNGFSLQKDKRVMLIGGGVGNAPLFYLAQELKKKNCQLVYLYGSRNKEYIYLEDEFKEATTELITCTDDGSKGLKGFTTDHMEKLLKESQFDYIYTCGPTPMMQKIANIASHYKTPVELSLENYFGCGIGLCSGCIVKTVHGQKKACVDGPVFPGDELIWE